MLENDEDFGPKISGSGYDVCLIRSTSSEGNVSEILVDAKDPIEALQKWLVFFSGTKRLAKLEFKFPFHIQ